VLVLLELTTLWLLLQLTTSFDFEGLPVLVLLDLTTPRLLLLPLKSFALGDQWKWKAHRHLELRQCSPAAPDDDDTRASMPVQALALEILPTSPTSCCIWLLSLLLYADNKAAEQ